MDLFEGDPISIDEKIGHLEREVGMRRSVYPRLVVLRKMGKEKADRGIAVMEAILADYKNQKAGQ